jgi:hypothetical protein
VSVVISQLSTIRRVSYGDCRLEGGLGTGATGQNGRCNVEAGFDLDGCGCSSGLCLSEAAQRDGPEPSARDDVTTRDNSGDLLMHQMFIESRWEWPIASHVQKLILFGLLPHLTWVVAAMIENAMY